MFLTREDGMILGPVCWVLGKIFNWIYMFVGFQRFAHHMYVESISSFSYHISLAQAQYINFKMSRATYFL